MPWKDTCVEEQRMKFMAAYLEADSGWSMSELCEVFGVSRKSGYQWLERYRDSGLDGLKDRSRAPSSEGKSRAGYDGNRHCRCELDLRYGRRQPWWPPS